MQQARALQQSEAFAGYRKHRVVVEHRLARLVQLGIRQARYFGRVKTWFQLYLAATVANLTLVAARAGLTGDIGNAASGDRAASADTGSVAAILGAIRLGQIWPLALLTPAFLPKNLFSTKAFQLLGSLPSGLDQRQLKLYLERAWAGGKQVGDPDAEFRAMDKFRRMAGGGPGR